LRKIEDEFYVLVVKGIDPRTYNQRFQELKILCPSMVPDLEKTLEKYVEGLPRNIEGDVTSSNPPNPGSSNETCSKTIGPRGQMK
jgi:hypothetical protein